MTDFNNLFSTGTWRMLGTEKTGEYTVRAASTRGRVGVRQLAGGRVRIRIEPTTNIGGSVLAKWRKKLARDIGYKQPGDSEANRFSIVVPAGTHADAILELMFGLLGQGKLASFILNPDMADPASTSNTLAA